MKRKLRRLGVSLIALSVGFNPAPWWRRSNQGS